MRRKFELILGLLFLMGIIVAAGKLSSYVSSNQVKKQEAQVFLDPGHGGKDPGKVGVSGTLEKELNLEIAKKVAKALEEQGVSVMITREKDQGLYSASAKNKKAEDMKNRVEMINSSKPSLCVSIHQNSYTDSSVKGAQSFYYINSSESKKAAELMQACLKEIDSNNKREAKGDGTYYMLKRTEVPTVIVECGFLSNPEEEKKLLDQKYQDQMAEAICEGILASLKMLEE